MIKIISNSLKINDFLGSEKYDPTGLQMFSLLLSIRLVKGHIIKKWLVEACAHVI